MRTELVACILSIATLSLTAAKSRAEDAPREVDLKTNPLVQKALADQEKATAEADAEFAKKLAAIKAERDQKLSAARTACVAALRRAEAVAKARNSSEEALTIHALADSIASDAGRHPDAQPNRSNPEQLVGRWKTEGGGFVLEADGTCRSTSSAQITGTWAVTAGGDIELRWSGFPVDTFRQISPARLKRSDGMTATRVRTGRE